ncbi:hypothetical protein J0818_28630 [Bacillus cereus]|uniref:Uncharacterized protein n=1 Tax=Bacillus mobilis TaxID=2026190 RepID=A0A1Y5Z2J7_9BACI|nr:MULTISPECIES: hypothetical protein [Bacillus cereus group]MBL3741140.1 hypothetical protein [Bacillus cereus]MBL3863834.1 hypothetical protein [Bacillus cereus]SMD78089.1 hypothetical protein BACERE00185_00991 [Bacillus mobilis]
MTGIGFLIMTVSKFGVAGAFTVGVTKAIDYFHTFDKKNKKQTKSKAPASPTYDYEAIRKELNEENV